ncbi:MAG TPA: Uma2 family endonuclease [Pirellulaceae bacterium]|nr:Uma2 family endonuclease [Pirellulaceae bacterium]
MASSVATGEKLMTIEQFAAIPHDDRQRELVKGKVVEMNLPKPKHGFICGEIAGLLREFVKPRKLGRVFSNDSGVITERDPDSLRGPDVGFYSFARVPAGPIPDGYYAVAPEIAFDVLSPDDVWARMLEKVAELLDAGVVVVCVVDPRDETVQVHRADQPIQYLQRGDELTVPDVLPGFSCKVSQIFEI